METVIQFMVKASKSNLNNLNLSLAFDSKLQGKTTPYNAYACSFSEFFSKINHTHHNDFDHFAVISKD